MKVKVTRDRLLTEVPPRRASHKHHQNRSLSHYHHRRHPFFKFLQDDRINVCERKVIRMLLDLVVAVQEEKKMRKINIMKISLSKIVRFLPMAIPLLQEVAVWRNQAVTGMSITKKKAQDQTPPILPLRMCTIITRTTLPRIIILTSDILTLLLLLLLMPTTMLLLGSPNNTRGTTILLLIHLSITITRHHRSASMADHLHHHSPLHFQATHG
mmetsp:Transcript_5952/g.14703  ORF Transcript_5952/g.14703 Transcript_5952/m.14703 type:complete len:213 (-) Transcript_5952:2937-3575(-)